MILLMLFSNIDDNSCASYYKDVLSIDYLKRTAKVISAVLRQSQLIVQESTAFTRSSTGESVAS
jgi:hypothetical protein